MRICIPVEKPNGMNSLVHMHFGSAPNFVIYDTTTKELETMNNADHTHMEGHCNPVSQFKSNPIDVLITSNMGGRALSIFNAQGVKVFTSETETTAAQAVSAFEAGKLRELTPDSACGYHHGCHHSL